MDASSFYKSRYVIRLVEPILMTLFLLLHFFVNAQILTKDLPREQKILGLSRFWSEVKFSFPYFDNVPSLNWDSAYTAFIPKVVNTKSEFEYIKVLKQFCALLKDGHTNILYPNKFYYDSLSTPAFHVKNIGRKAFVDLIPDLSNKAVPRGSEIIAVNGINIVTFLKDSIIPFVCEGTEESLWNTAIQKELLLGIQESSVELSFKTPSGTVIKRNLVRDYSFNRISEMELPDELVNYRWYDNILCVGIKSFSNPRVVTQFKNILPQLYQAKAIIIDIRDNTGGNDNYAAEISKYFLTGDSIIGVKVESRNHIAAYKAFGRNNPEYKPFLENRGFFDLGLKKYPDTISIRISVPLVILTNISTRSASENFLVIMDYAKRCTIIGQATGGTTGQPYFFKLVDEVSAALCSPRNTYPDGRKFVGLGIQPDIEVSETYDDFIKNKDAVLEKAINYLSIKIR